MHDPFAGLRWKDWSFFPTSAPARRRNELGLNLLLFGYLGFTFLSALILYLFTAAGHSARSAASVPSGFWVSTAFVLVGGACLRAAVRAVRREKQRRTRRLVAAAVVCGLAFAVGQGVGVAQMIAEYRAAPIPRVTFPDGTSYLDPVAKSATPLTGVVAMLVFLHGLHFAGGLLTLLVTAARTFAGRYDHEYHGGLLLTARYWTFLDASWLVMLGTFWLTL